MRILYSVAGEGMGHATRSKAVLEHLKKQGHTIKISATGPAYTYLSKHFNQVTRVSGLHIAYKNNKVQILGTILTNFSNVKAHLKTIKTIFRLITSFKPGLIINDFTFTANYMGIFLGYPVINLDNNRVAAKTKVKIPLKFWPSRVRTALATNLIAPMGYFHIVTSFFYPPLRMWHNAKLVFPPIREKILRLKTREDAHLLIYQTSDTNQKLLEDLKELNKQCIIYGYGKRPDDKKLEFKAFNEKEFFDDLASAQVVIMNGGFSLMAECLYLKKPILSIPVKGQFEQELNALYLDRLGYGRMLEESDLDQIKEFLKEKNTFRKQLNKTQFNPMECLELVDEKIKEVKQLDV